MTDEEYRQELERIEKDIENSQRSTPKEWLNTLIRYILTVAFCFTFWKYEWVTYILWVIIPYEVLNLFTLLVMPRVLKKKLAKAKKLMEDE